MDEQNEFANGTENVEKNVENKETPVQENPIGENAGAGASPYTDPGASGQTATPGMRLTAGSRTSAVSRRRLRPLRRIRRNIVGAMRITTRSPRETLDTSRRITQD